MRAPKCNGNLLLPDVFLVFLSCFKFVKIFCFILCTLELPHLLVVDAYSNSLRIPAIFYILISAHKDLVQQTMYSHFSASREVVYVPGLHMAVLMYVYMYVF